MKNLKNSLYMVLLLALSTGCNNDDDNKESKDSSLVILKTNISGTNLTDPVVDVPVESSFELIFSHALDPEKIGASLTVVSKLNMPDYEIEFSNSNSTVTIIMDDPLNYETLYTISLPQGVYGVNGETLDISLSLSFITASFVLPALSLSSNTITGLTEDGQSAIITATLSKQTDRDVNGTFVFSGSADKTTDYDVTGEETFTIPAGSLSTAIIITTILDANTEGNEIIDISLDNVTNATASSQIISVPIIEQLPALSLKGIMSLTWNGSGGYDGKAIHLIANKDIVDLSLYGLGIANNGEGTDGKEYIFPAISVLAGDDILLAREPVRISAYLRGCSDEFERVLTADISINQNGDDAIELYQGNTVIETYGDIDVDGTGQSWEYTGSWAYKKDGFWITGGTDCSGGATVNASSCPYPICMEPITLQGVLALVWDGSGSTGGKAIHLKVNKDIPDLSIYGIGVANNGGGTDGVEYRFRAISVQKGDDILLARERATIATYFGDCISLFEHVIETEAMDQNGDDAIEVFKGKGSPVVTETYGSINTDGSGKSWEYTGTWAYKRNGTWTVGKLKCAAGSTATQDSDCPYPVCN